MHSKRQKRMSKDWKYLLFSSVVMLLSVITLIILIPITGSGFLSLVITIVLSGIAIWLGAKSILGPSIVVKKMIR